MSLLVEGKGLASKTWTVQGDLSPPGLSDVSLAESLGLRYRTSLIIKMMEQKWCWNLVGSISIVSLVIHRQGS